VRSIKALGAFLFGLVLGACAKPSSPAAAPNNNTAFCEAQAFELRGKTVALVGDTGRPFCAGVWVSEEAFLTANHCVEDDDDVSKTVFAYAVYSDIYRPGSLRESAYAGKRAAQVVATDPEHDLALLHVRSPIPTHGVARVALDTLRPGSFVSTMGHPYGFGWSYSSGQVAALRERMLVHRDILWVQATAPISPGNSGGGLFDNQSNLVGLTSNCAGISGVCTSVNFFVHAQYIDALLRRESVWLR
jgi:S1-C subfamily serine protease